MRKRSPGYGFQQSLLSFFIFYRYSCFVYFLTPRRWKNACLLAGSLLFYSFGVKDHPLYAAFLLFSVFVNYRLGIRLGRRRKSGCRKGWLAAGIFYNLSCLCCLNMPDLFRKILTYYLLKQAAPSGCQVPPLFCPLESASTHSRQ